MANQWIIRKFYKNKAVRAIIHYPDKRIRTYWCLPKDNTITINNKTYRCDTKVDYFNIWNGIPTFTYQVDKIEPLVLNNQVESLMTTEEFNVALNNKVVREVFASADKKIELVTAIIVGMVAVVVIVGIAGYFLYQEMGVIRASVDNLNKYFGIGVPPVGQ